MKFLPILVMALVAVVAATPAPAPEDQRKKKPKHCGEFGDPCSKQPCCGSKPCLPSEIGVKYSNHPRFQQAVSRHGGEWGDE
ncbi:predicted protein [Histoplasma mississippiense (nom. inval.)]|uniref:predicted protein n=1 Tax=Ajellomyces capsulatus (strain NAm1 / WU24) TaxID=2059318 RepID=UPI000157CD41|nr:predicted protein [Histoplasma mississippiense (nom. inval.)]EDN10134.1 predicted protein [Histoplasma mississippiense (nom. inval.)]